MSNDQSSSLQATIDQTKGVVQSTWGSLTGSNSEQTKGQAKQDKGNLEADLSHSVGKVGPFAVSGSGGVAQDDPDRTSGSWNQTAGAAKESIGNLVGAEGLKREGIEQNQQGKAQEAKGQLNDFGGGMANRVKGAVGSGVAGLTGDTEGQQRYQQQHDDGKAQQRSAEADIQKQNQ